MLKVRFPVALLFIFFGALAGCAHISGSEQPLGADFSENRPVIAVAPFQGVSEARGSGLIVSDILTNQLYVIGKYNVIAPETVVARLGERDLETMPPAEIGTLLGAPYIVTGRVTEYTYKAGVGETPAVGITARLLESATGKVLWSATRTGVGGGNWIFEDSLSWLSGELCEELADSLDSYLDKYLAEPAQKGEAPAPRTPENSERK